ncbi:DUF2851 family protein [Flavobacterium sp.]|uniref:DUF2851 family protein n=1 Tax=Flavobacterium sp. TaxID=239 RepID=UPI0026058303|nr:DUF2851 family protein [Flavobacterium sp.]MDD3004471.1 DUF2851 family protein [Flavobacterium sp.]
MKEDFLHYLWRYKKFQFHSLQTSKGERLSIQDGGSYLENAGPDFFNAQITINDQKWAGNIEIHVKSSDWYLHNHEKDKAYENVILHVVWEHDVEVFTKNNTAIPVLVLQNYVSPEIIQNYNHLAAAKKWIYCENQIKDIHPFVFNNWLERLYIERLQLKQEPILQLFQKLNKDWEAVLFCLLAKNFGLNTNGNAFLEVATHIPYSVIRKESYDPLNIEALLLGFSGLLDVEKEDLYFKDLKKRFDYLILKHQLEYIRTVSVQFFKLRPDNFPTIRLSQLAHVLAKNQQLFTNLIYIKSLHQAMGVFDVGVSDYWKTHYTFDKPSSERSKKISIKFVELLLINTIVPLQYAYSKSRGEERQEQLIEIISQVNPEQNIIIDKFENIGIKAVNAFETQSLLELKNEYCNPKRCLSCAIGMELLNGAVPTKNV